MKQFFGAFFGSVVGIVISTILAVILFAALITSGFKDAFKSMETKGYREKPNSVLNLVFDGPIIDREKVNPFEKLDMGPWGGDMGMGLNIILKNLDNASKDSTIKGLFLNFKNLQAGTSDVQDIRKAILSFKKSGKFVYAYSENYSQNAYYLASAADKVYLNPQGGMDWKGLSMSLMFYKKTLEKLGVEVQIFRHGKFKSAIEPFMLEKMSEANRLQAETFLNSIWNNMLIDISESRKISIDELNKKANELAVVFPEDAMSNGLIDELAYEDEVLNAIKAKLKLREKDKLNFVTHKTYSKHKEKDRYKGKDKIAVIYAVGGISSGDGDDDEIGSDRIAKAIKDARLDENIKAIVLRVNSPGGSALASDVIWREVNLAKKSKPFIVSMGDVAASGGYYISCAADRIFAQANTITGSIGVFGIVPNMKKALEDKLGITVDTVNTNAYSDVMSTLRGATPTESVFIQKSVEKVYDVFITKVATGRQITKEEVDNVGQGRVWSGSDALKIKLVDEIGGLTEAIAYAAKQAKLKEFKLTELPKQKNPFEEILGNIEIEAESKIMQKNLGQHYKYLKQIQSIIQSKGVQVRLPFEIYIH